MAQIMLPWEKPPSRMFLFERIIAFYLMCGFRPAHAREPTDGFHENK